MYNFTLTNLQVKLIVFLCPILISYNDWLKWAAVWRWCCWKASESIRCNEEILVSEQTLLCNPLRCTAMHCTALFFILVHSTALPSSALQFITELFFYILSFLVFFDCFTSYYYYLTYLNNLILILIWQLRFIYIHTLFLIIYTYSF